ncbi:MAG TPA: 50S ribosomal protein L22 [Pirellulaceae bacterium]
MATFRATHRHVRISPRKVRPLADLIRGKLADEALEVLKFQPHRGARLLEKVLQSALGSSRDPDHPANRGRAIDAGMVWVSEVTIDGGPIFKRIRPRARGMAFSIKKRTSHINVSVDTE